ncbi:MAG TPA: cbb3-type cytochrome c oxidase subunit II [Vicinamibacterales bacterium]|nr:cbb3-type cytochrome c oxidase subunit II [Vicinamibacterales bacterium]
MSSGHGRVLGMSYLVASVAGVVFFVLSVALLGYWPKRVLDEQTRAMGPEYVLELTPSERRGRAVYSREGCAYCHTQQIRYLASDRARFGAPTLAWETRLDYPHLWGTRRIGPDLSREGGTRSDDWHYTHLFSPRAVVPQSVMPAYGRLFDGAPNRPRQQARDLVAYLNTLGRARELAGPEGEARAEAGCQCPDDEMAHMAFGGELNAHPARTRRTHDTPSLLPAGDLARGRQLFAAHCATCHGPTGGGDGPGATGLLPAPVNLAEHQYASARVADVLWNGVAGTAMPAWRDHSPDDRAALVSAVLALGSTRPEPSLPDNLMELGQRAFRANCVQCHGERGDGSGSAAAELPIAPTNFVRQRPTLSAALRALRGGIPGTPMAPWTMRLSDAELVAAAQYVRTLYGAPGAESR